MVAHEYFMCADVGGTNSRMQLFKISRSDLSKPEVRGGGKPPGDIVHEHKYQNQDYPTGFDMVCYQFLKECKEVDPAVETCGVGAACFAMAGPVHNNTVEFTNRKEWVVNGEELQTALKIPSVRLINDFVANGYGILTLDPKTDVHTLVEAGATPNAPIACVGAGTGLGMTYATCPPNPDGEYDAYASEGGHTEFSPRTTLEIELLEFLKKDFGENARVSAERIVSGKGMMNVYRFLKTKWPNKVRQDIEDEMKKLGDDAGFAIATHGHANPGTPEYDQLCQTCMEIFWSAYGCEVGSAGLKWLPYGGLYIAGGIAQKNLDQMKFVRPSKKTPNLTWGFLPAYRDKGRVGGVLDRVPLHVITAGDVGQRGAQLVALRGLRMVKGIKMSEGKSKKQSIMSKFLTSPALYAAGVVALAAFLRGKK